MTFQQCTFCHGRGCLACDGERKKYEAAQTEKIKNWRPPTERELSLATSLMQSMQAHLPGPKMTKDELEARLQIPPSALTITYENLDQFEENLARAKECIGREALEHMAEEAGGDPQVFRDKLLEKAEAFRIEQSMVHDQKEK